MAGSDLSLVFADPEGHPVVFAIPEGTTSVGSAKDNDLVLAHDTISPHQVVIMREGDDLSLQGLFAGETRVNDEVRASGPLGAGDVLRLGDVKLRIMRVAASRQTKALPRGRRTTRRLRVRGQQSLLDPGPETPAPEAEPAEAPAKPAGAAEPKEPTPPESATPPERDAAPTPRVATPVQPPKPDADALLAKQHDARRARALAKARLLSDEIMPQDDFEAILERIAESFLEIFSAERAVTILFEEDGRNPLLTVERRRSGTDDGAGVAQEIIDRCLQVRSVIRVTGGMSGLAGLAAPLIARGNRALGLLYFERNTSENALDADDVHLMALLTNVISLVIAPLID
jgi:hypothetical protein